MIDTRSYEKKADELIAQQCSLTLRVLCMDSYIMEKVLSPSGGLTPTTYTVETNAWYPRGDYRPDSVVAIDTKKMRYRRRASPTKTYALDQGVINEYLAVLLSSGYVVIDDPKGGK